MGRTVVSRSADSRVDPTSAQRCAQRRAGGCESFSQPCDIVRVGGRCLRGNGEARQNRHANRRTSDFMGRCYRHHRHRNWLCRQIGDERDGLWAASATRREARGWWQVKGVRDIVSGVLVIVAIITARADLWWLVLVLSLIPLGDALVVLTNGGRKSAAFGIHGATAAAMIIAALLLERS